MKTDTHPQTQQTTFLCNCGAKHVAEFSTLSGTVNIEICSKCHPHYTGEKKLVDTAGRVEKFRKKWEKAGKSS